MVRNSAPPMALLGSDIFSEDQGSHGSLCFYLVDIIYIFISKCRIPLRTLIFIPYDCQGISIICPVTGSSPLALLHLLCITYLP